MTAIAYIVGGLLAGLVGLMLLSRVMVAVNVRRHQGRPAPTLPGTTGEQLESGRPALFYFFSPSCGACRAMTPVVSQLARSDPRVHPVDVSQDMDTARRFGVMATPTTVFVDAGVVQKILIGPQSKTTLEGLLQAA